MNMPQFLLMAPIALAVVLYLIRRWPLIAGPVAAAAAWIVVIIVLGFDLGDQTAGAIWSVFGRSFILTEQTQMLLVTVYAIMGVIFLLSAFLAQSAIFIALSFAVLSPLGGALMVQPFVYGAVLLLIGAGALAAIIQGGRAGSTQAALRFLSLTAFAVPLLLVAGWMIEGDRFRFLDTVTLLIIAAIMLLTASFPFQIWVAPVVRESSTLAPAVVYGAVQFLVVVFCLNLLIEQPFVYGSAQFQGVVSMSAAATLILGGALAMTARSFGHLLGYLLLLSIGAVLAVIGSGGAAAVQVTLSLLLLRVLSLIIAGAGLGAIRSRAAVVVGGANQFAANEGLAWRTPLGVGLFVFGCLSLAGLPLTPGFAGSWPAVLVIGQQASWLAAILVLSIAAGAFGVLRRLIPLLNRPDPADGHHNESPATKLEKVIALTLIAAGVILALFPRLVLTHAAYLADLF